MKLVKVFADTAADITIDVTTDFAIDIAGRIELKA